MSKPRLVVLSGAGVSAESGIRTFRDNSGLWEDHDVMDVATPEGFARDPVLVHRFYNARRAQLAEVSPNAAHFAIAGLEDAFEVSVITQNVDDLHERAGSKHVVHLHGELLKATSVGNPTYVADWTGDLGLDDVCPDGFPLRPHVVWFGEQVPAMELAAPLVARADAVVVVGTSMQVYPAAGLVSLADRGAAVYYVDPAPSLNPELSGLRHLRVITGRAAEELPRLAAKLRASLR